MYYLYRETLSGGKTTPQHAAEALASVEGVNMVSWHGGAKAETQQRMDWNAAGVPVQEPYVSDVEAGIDRVIGLFKAHQLYVFDTCVGVLDELGTYSREVESGQATDKIQNRPITG